MQIERQLLITISFAFGFEYLRQQSQEIKTNKVFDWWKNPPPTIQYMHQYLTHVLQMVRIELLVSVVTEGMESKDCTAEGITYCHFIFCAGRKVCLGANVKQMMEIWSASRRITKQMEISLENGLKGSEEKR